MGIIFQIEDHNAEQWQRHPTLSTSKEISYSITTLYREVSSSQKIYYYCSPFKDNRHMKNSWGSCQAKPYVKKSNIYICTDSSYQCQAYYTEIWNCFKVCTTDTNRKSALVASAVALYMGKKCTKIVQKVSRDKMESSLISK